MDGLLIVKAFMISPLDGSIQPSVHQIMTLLGTRLSIPISEVYTTSPTYHPHWIRLSISYHVIMSQIHHAHKDPHKTLNSIKLAVGLAKTCPEIVDSSYLIFQYIVLLLHYRQFEQAILEGFAFHNIPCNLDYTEYANLYKQHASRLIANT
jgi:hypothetical protein